MSVQHANRGIVKKDLQLYYNREFSKSFRGESSTNLITNTVTSSGPWDGNLFNNWINATVTENVDIAPDGTMTAVRLTGGYARWTNSITVDASTTYTASIWLKNINLGVDPAINIAAGLNGTLVSYVVANSTITRSTIANWRRVSVTYTIPASGVNQIQFGVRYEGDYPNQNSILVWGAQFEKKAYMTQYSNLATDYFSRNETITNLLTSTYSSLPTNWTVDNSGFGVTGTYSYIENNSAIRIVDVNTNTRFNTGNLSGFSASTTYTFSVKYRKVSGTPTLRFQIQWYNASSVSVGSVSFPTTPQVSIYNIDGWQLAKFTVTSPVAAARMLWFIQDGDDYTGYTHSYDLKEPQIQTGTYPTKYASNTATANSLTSGGGLLDISGNNVNADLTNVSFDSSGYSFTSAGNNYLNTGITTLPSNTQLTIDVWTKPTNTTQARTLVSKWGSSSQSNFCFLLFLNFFAQGNIYFLVGDSLGTSYSTHSIAHNLSTSVYSNFTIVYDNGLISWYRNGVFVSPSVTSANTVLKTVTTAITIGADFDGGNPDTLTRSYDGTIPNVRLYSRPLTAAEVLQNFNATRTTYGI
jgi:hypothetical protein